MDFFTSDAHFGHNNIIRYCNRPFVNADEMDEIIISNWNKKAKANDRIFYLGDWCLPGRDKSYLQAAMDYRRRIHCKKIIFIYGNHDRKARGNDGFHRLFDGCYDLLETNIGYRRIVLCHYAMRVWNKSHHGTWMLYGHSHSTLPDDPNALSIDVGVDSYAAMNKTEDGKLLPEMYTLFSIHEIEEIMNKKQWKPVDHHGEQV